MIEEAPPLPPLPPEEEAQPPPPPTEPPSAPALPPLPTAQTSYQSASRTARPSHQSRWQQPDQLSSQQATLQQAVSSSGYPPQCSGSLSKANGTGSNFSTIRVKTEDGAGTRFDTVPAAVKTEAAAGTTSRIAQMSSGQQQAQQPGGAIQFGFRGIGEPAGKVTVYCQVTITTCNGWSYVSVPALCPVSGCWVSRERHCILFAWHFSLCSCKLTCRYLAYPIHA